MVASHASAASAAPSSPATASAGATAAASAPAETSQEAQSRAERIQARLRAEDHAREQAAAEQRAREQAEREAARAAEEARAEAARAEAQEKARAVAPSAAEKPQTEVAAASPVPPPAPAPVAPPAVAAVRAPERPAAAEREAGKAQLIEEIGFLQTGDGSRVFVRTRGAPRFSVAEGGDKLVELRLDNARLKNRNDARALDTSFFPSAVVSVTPRRQGPEYLLEIRLREKVAYQQKVEGDLLALDFARPASAPGALAEKAAAVQKAPPAAGPAPVVKVSVPAEVPEPPIPLGN